MSSKKKKEKENDEAQKKENACARLFDIEAVEDNVSVREILSESKITSKTDESVGSIRSNLPKNQHRRINLKRFRRIHCIFPRMISSLNRGRGTFDVYNSRDLICM